MKRKSLILRLWLDDAGNFHGQLSDPHTHWRKPFSAESELWELLKGFMGEMPAFPPANRATTVQEKNSRWTVK